MMTRVYINMGSGVTSCAKPLEQAVDQIRRPSEALTQEQVRGVEREEAMRHLQDSLSDEQRRLNNVRDALDKEMQLTKQLEEKLSFEKSNVSLLGIEKSHQEKKEIRRNGEMKQQNVDGEPLNSFGRRKQTILSLNFYNTFRPFLSDKRQKDVISTSGKQMEKLRRI